MVIGIYVHRKDITHWGLVFVVPAFIQDFPQVVNDPDGIKFFFFIAPEHHPVIYNIAAPGQVAQILELIPRQK